MACSNMLSTNKECFSELTKAVEFCAVKSNFQSTYLITVNILVHVIGCFQVDNKNTEREVSLECSRKLPAIHMFIRSQTEVYCIIIV